MKVIWRRERGKVEDVRYPLAYCDVYTLYCACLCVCYWNLRQVLWERWRLAMAIHLEETLTDRLGLAYCGSLLYYLVLYYYLYKGTIITDKRRTE